MLMRALFSEVARLEPNTSCHVSHHCTLDLLEWREGTRVSPSRLPVFLQPCPSSPEPLLAVIASGLITPHGSRKQQSHFTSWYTVAHSGVDDACCTLRRARIFHTLPPPNALACRRHFHHVSAAHISSSSSSPQRFPSLAPAAIAVLAIVVLALIALVLLDVPLGISALLGVLGMVIGVAALLGPLLCTAVVLCAALFVVVRALLVTLSGVLLLSAKSCPPPTSSWCLSTS